MKRPLWIAATVFAVFICAAAAEVAMGRLPLGPDHRFGIWESDIWSSEQSQRLLEPYSLTDIIQGMAFYALLWFFARRMAPQSRFVLAVVLEGVWEVMENSRFIIDRYRTVTISLGYVGDSVLNSMSDIVMMMAGFALAMWLRPWMTVAILILIEAGMLIVVRDNLTLNIIMLIYPVQAIKVWQSAGH